MKRLLISISTLVLTFFLFTGCSTFAEGVKEGLEQAKSNDIESVQTIKSDLSNISMSFPESWKEATLNDVATIQMSLEAKEQYMIVIEETSEDFEDEFTVDDYATIIMENMKTTVEGADVSMINESIIGNNISARQFELSGSVNKIKAKFLITCIEHEDVFYQFTAWSTQSKYEEAKPVFENILKSINF